MPTSPRHLVELLELRSAESPDRTAYTFLLDGERAEENLTYAGLASRARTIAAALQAQLAPGARVVLLYPPGLDYISAFLGCLYGGFVAVPAYPPDPSRLNRTLPRLQAIVNDAGADVVLTTSAILGMTEVLASFAPDLGKKRWLATDAPGIGAASAWRRPDIRPETLAFLQYTSGSTGVPKGVMLTHENLLANERMIRDVFKLTKDSVGVGWLPLYHDMGLIGNVLQTLYSGFRCILMSPLDFLHRPIRWLEAISRYGGTASGGPNFSYDLCVRKISPEDRKHLDLRSWKLAFSGAEPVRPETLDLFSRTFADCGFERTAFLPCYGLAEASLLVSGKTMGTDYKVARLAPSALEEGRAQPTTAPEARALVSTGPAVAGSQVVVVDPTTSRACPPGRIGEIWVAGPHVAVGYWNDAEKSERTFGARLMSSHPELAAARFLRTGDLGFYLGGELHISGRLKDLIIIRGRNYYPQDIEKVVEESYPTLRRGCTGAFSVEQGGEERLVVAVEIERRVRTADRRTEGPPSAPAERRATSDRRASEPPPGLGPAQRADYRPDEVFDAIRRNIGQAFSLHVHAIVLLKAGSIPKTSSGKIQRHACRAGYLESSLEVVSQHMDEPAAISEAPISLEQVNSVRPVDRGTMVEAFVRTELARVLRVKPSDVDLNAPLSGLGLDSLMAVEVNHAVERNLGVVLPVTLFLRDGSGRDLARTILSKIAAWPGSGPPRSSRPPATASTSERSSPLTSGQQALWFLYQLAPASTAYNIASALRVRGSVVPAALESALQTLVERHAALRTTYAAVDGQPTQTPMPALAKSFRLPLVDVSHLAEADARALIADDTNTPFDLENGPVFRATLFRNGPGDHTLALSAHHIAADLWSIVVLLSELQELYSAAREGRVVPPAVKDEGSYSDFVAWEHDYLSGQAELDWAYWRAQLEHAAPLDLPTDRTRPPVQTYGGASHRIAFGTDHVARLAEFAKAEGVTIYVVLLAAFQVLLGRYSGQSRFLVGSPVAGRPRAAFDRTVGYFVNALPMAADLSGRPSGRELVRRVKETVLGALEHQNFPFAMSVQRSQVARDASRSPLFQAMFVLEKAYLDKEADVTMLVLGASDGKADFAGLELKSCPLPQRSAQFDVTLNLAQGGDNLAGSLDYNTDLFDGETVARMGAHFVALVDSLVERPAARIQQLALLDPLEATRLVEDWNATRVEYPRRPTLAELIEAQVRRRPDAVAITFEGRSVTYRALDALANRIAATLAGAGIGLEDRVAVFMERSVEMVATLVAVIKAGAAYVPIDPSYPADRVAFMVGDSQAAALVTQRHLRHRVGAGAPPIIEADGDLQEAPGGAAAKTIHPLSAAYVIYTSGSTGQPKGAINTHGALLNRLRWMQQTLHLVDGDAVLQKTSFSFDVSVWEFFWPLIVGARIVVARPEGQKDASYLVDLIRREGVSVLHFVPSMLQPFLEDEAASSCSSLRTVVCSGEALPHELAQRFHDKLRARLHNLYGPTEAAIDVSRFESVRGAPGPVVPIGKPIANTQLFVLDEELAPVPIGVPGQLYIGGVQLARGYWGNPALTAERFVASPFGTGRLYATGDRAKLRTDGNIEYLGRLDFQVKVRGFRIELGEIESALRQVPGVVEAAVIVRQDGPGDARLVAYVVPRAENAPTVGDLRSALERRLPEYMVPFAFVTLAALPLSPNGKLERKALPAPANVEPAAAYKAPATPAEEVMCRIAAELLRATRVGVDDNFFELGGHSLLATQFVSRVRSELHVAVSVRALFENPTIARLSEQFFDPTSEEGEI